MSNCIDTQFLFKNPESTHLTNVFVFISLKC